ncbi:vacuolar import and degradation protein-domain-containing protein [Annulohypoxylon maeteangense]|uniref:vacuolar import and degradation protein-domain-containing protein n=1 Tax=Annulohypoxylon maeteangense TaxID=1927788 RepID=UPI0020072CFB|nr:vacuolar import and degradation protein-domain-containing protein [Annulohypoxylon maeteangense]KAI0882976.1 vacuolar import and degradation protein-domain-containing protein [Annulohypoxylon maeteangense]
MPTPSNNPPPELPPRTHSSSCPDPEEAARNSWRPDQDGLAMNIDGQEVDSSSPEPVSAPPPAALQSDISDLLSATESPRPDSRSGTEPTILSSDRADSPSDSTTATYKPTDADDDASARGDMEALPTRQRRSGAYELASSIGADGEKLEYGTALSRSHDDAYAPSMGFDYSNVRIIPTSPSSFLRPGSRFHGTQQSERQVYDVQVEIKYVDLRESFLCGFLKIQGLTEDNPTLTTYFEGELIGSKYGFITKHENWGATEKIDLNHWGKFSAFRQYSKQVRRGPVAIPNLAQRENIFMRWKEHFLVPDHRVRTINGASFEGFYYICFNQKEGSVSGIYFHSKSEKFQQLELKHVEDKGCFGDIEFR